MKLVVRHKETATYAKELTSYPMNVQITNLGDSVNSQYPDYCFVVFVHQSILPGIIRNKPIYGD